MSNKIVVMHFVSGLKSGGVEQMLYNYCKNMDKNKFKFIVVYQHEAVEACFDKMNEISEDVVQITARCDNFFGNIVDSFRVIKKYKPDIVHTHMNLMNCCALLAAWLNHVKVRISHSHIAEVNRGYIYCVCANIFKLCIKLFATDYFTCGKEAGEYLYGKKWMNMEGKVKHIVNAIDIDQFLVNDVDRKHLRNEMQIENKFVVGHVGRFSEQKNHVRLIDIFAKIKEQRSDAVLILVGTGELLGVIQNKVADMHLNDSVYFLGNIKDMSKLYSVFDVFLLPSLYEGFPVVSIEVQAANIPAVFSNSVATTCNITGAIKYLSLDNSDEEWVTGILKFYKEYQKKNLDCLKSQYDIRLKAHELQKIYVTILERSKIK